MYRRADKMRMTEKRKTTLAAVLALAAMLASCTGDISSDLGIGTQGTTTDGAVITDENGSEYTSADPTSPYNGMLNGEEVISVDITMSEQDLTAMRANAAAELYYPAKIAINGTVCDEAGIRTRGNVNFVSENSSDRYSYKINFGKYVKGTKLNGLDEMCLNNAAYDPSFLREYITYAAFYALDANAPLCSLATVTINGECAGVYLALEAIDNSFLKREFSSKDGNLYKAQKGSTLVNGAVGFELKSGEDLSLTYIKKLANALSGNGNIEDVLDVSSVLKYIAVNAVVANENSYMGKSAENFYFYEQNGRLTMLPWDYNLAFGTDKSERKNNYTIESSLITSSISSPYFGTTGQERPLASVLLANDKYYAEYLGYVKQLSEYLDSLQTKLPEYKTMIDAQVKGDLSKLYSNELFDAEFTEADNTLLGFIKKRNDSVKGMLNGN